MENMITTYEEFAANVLNCQELWGEPLMNKTAEKAWKIIGQYPMAIRENYYRMPKYSEYDGEQKKAFKIAWLELCHKGCGDPRILQRIEDIKEGEAAYKRNHLEVVRLFDDGQHEAARQLYADKFNDFETPDALKNFKEMFRWYIRPYAK